MSFRDRKRQERDQDQRAAACAKHWSLLTASFGLPTNYMYHVTVCIAIQIYYETPYSNRAATGVGHLTGRRVHHAASGGDALASGEKLWKAEALRLHHRFLGLAGAHSRSCSHNETATRANDADHAQ